VIIAGDGPLRNELESLARTLGLGDRIRWLGWQADLSRFYNAIDILTFNSDWDALGRTPIEALAAGIPFVGSLLNGGLAEALPPEYPWLLKHHDVHGLAQFCCNVFKDPEQARQIALGAREHLGQFSPEEDTKRLLQLLLPLQ
jgi:glycosyltransferase involved in cell wall biosynthesis